MTKSKPDFHGINLNSLRQSAEHLSAHILPTPTIFAPSLSNLLGASVHLKLENLQYTSSFKSRGDIIALKALRDENKKSRRDFNVCWQSCSSIGFSLTAGKH